MKYIIDNNLLTVYLDERVDSNNATEVASEIEKYYNEAKSACPNGFHIVFDADKLLYISSAGLRVVINYRKKDPEFKVINVCSDVYEIFSMTGFTEMMTIEKAFRKLSVDGCTIIGKGAKGTVYRYNDDTIIKVYNSVDSLPDIKNERELARRAFVLGIPTAISYDIVKVGEKYGSVFELLNAKSYSQVILEDPDNFDKYVTDYALLSRQIHSTNVKADDMPDMKIFVRDWLKMDEPFLDKDEYLKIKKLIDDLPDTLKMLHCDYHTNNVMLQNGETLLIDMDTLSHGHPIFELGNVYITYVGFGEEDPSIVEKFIGLPFETAKNIWKKYISVYLGTEDKEEIKKVEDKARLLSYVRLMRHTIRRGGAETEEGRNTIALCKENISSLLKTVDTLDF